MSLRLAVLLAWCASAAALTYALTSCAPSLGPAEQAEIGATAATILRCQSEGRACAADGGADAGCYSACMKDGGLR